MTPPPDPPFPGHDPFVKPAPMPFSPPTTGYAPMGYGPPSPMNPYARPSQAMAIWALVLSFIWCLPFAPLVSIGLAIGVLARSRRGLNHGRGKAIAAVVISGLAVLAWVALIVLGGVVGSSDANTDGGSTSPYSAG